MTLDEFFAGKDHSRRIFDALHRAICDIGPSEMRVSKSQVAFRRRKAFAWAWTPSRYLRGAQAPLVLTLSLPRKDRSGRWKQVVEPTKGRYTHHVELLGPEDIDPEVCAWLQTAWSQAG